MTAQTKQEELHNKIDERMCSSCRKMHLNDRMLELINSEVLSALEEVRQTEQLSWHSLDMDDVDSYDSAFEQGVDKQYAEFTTKIESIKNRYKL